MRNKMLLAAGAVAIVVAILLYNKYRIAKQINVEALALTDVRGREIKLEEFKGKNLFLNFFATWCGPCLQEMQSLESAQASLAGDNILFLVISDEPVSRLKAYQEQSGRSLTIVHSQRSLKDEKIYTLPTSYLLNADRKIVFSKVGIAAWDDSSMIKELRVLSK
jgi:thiol-disulfide isomerase/thioredoxin